MDCTVIFTRTGAFVKVLFWTDSGNILGLVPPSGLATSSSSYSLVTAAVVAGVLVVVGVRVGELGRESGEQGGGCGSVQECVGAS